MRILRAAQDNSGDFIITNPIEINRGILRGAFDLELPHGIIVLGVMLFENPDRRWVDFPSEEWTRKDGSKGHSPLIEFVNSAAKAQFQKKVLPKAEKALGLNGRAK